jgi:hypothetical protein
LHIVIVVAIINAHNAVPVGQKPPAKMVAYKTRRAGHKNMHENLPECMQAR